LDTGIPRLTSFCTYIFCPQPRALIRTEDDENIFGLLNSHDKEVTLHDNVEIRKQNAPEKVAEKSQSELQPEERNMTYLKCSDGLELTETGIKVSEDSNEQRAATNRLEIMRVVACYEDVLKEKDLSLQI
jgi:hypothetical protein